MGRRRAGHDHSHEDHEHEHAEGLPEASTEGHEHSSGGPSDALATSEGADGGDGAVAKPLTKKQQRHAERAAAAATAELAAAAAVAARDEQARQAEVAADRLRTALEGAALDSEEESAESGSASDSTGEEVAEGGEAESSVAAAPNAFAGLLGEESDDSGARRPVTFSCRFPVFPAIPSRAIHPRPDVLRNKLHD